MTAYEVLKIFAQLAEETADDWDALPRTVTLDDALRALSAGAIGHDHVLRLVAAAEQTLSAQCPSPLVLQAAVVFAGLAREHLVGHRHHHFTALERAFQVARSVSATTAVAELFPPTTRSNASFWLRNFGSRVAVARVEFAERCSVEVAALASATEDDAAVVESAVVGYVASLGPSAQDEIIDVVTFAVYGSAPVVDEITSRFNAAVASPRSARQSTALEVDTSYPDDGGATLVPHNCGHCSEVCARLALKTRENAQLRTRIQQLQKHNVVEQARDFNSFLASTERDRYSRVQRLHRR
jgi:hypothetical protein